jgi:hypothetical protein
MRVPTRLAATLATAVTLAVPAGAIAATPPSMPSMPNFGPDPNLCLKGVVDFGPLGPMGPYGPDGPYGAKGPLNGQPNPLGNVATCGGSLTYILRGGTLPGFVQANLNSAGQ